MDPSVDLVPTQYFSCPILQNGPQCQFQCPTGEVSLHDSRRPPLLQLGRRKTSVSRRGSTWTPSDDRCRVPHTTRETSSTPPKVVGSGGSGYFIGTEVKVLVSSFSRL